MPPKVTDAVQQWAAETLVDAGTALADAGIGGGSMNFMAVSWNSIAQDGTTQRYTVDLDPSIVDLNGNAVQNWEVVPGSPGTESAKIRSTTRKGLFWICTTCLQSGNEVNVRRAFVSAFEDRPARTTVGIAGCATGFQGNNDRGETTLAYGGLLQSIPLFFEIAWNGNTPLTLNSGQVILLSS